MFFSKKLKEPKLIFRGLMSQPPRPPHPPSGRYTDMNPDNKLLKQHWYKFAAGSLHLPKYELLWGRIVNVNINIDSIHDSQTKLKYLVTYKLDNSDLSILYCIYLWPNMHVAYLSNRTSMTEPMVKDTCSI